MATVNIEPTAASAGATIGRFELRAPLGMATDGASYAAFSQGEAFELRRIDPERRTDALRRRVLLSRSIHHPAVLAIREAQLDGEPPYYLAVPAIEGAWDEPGHWPRRVEDATEAIAGLVHGLAEAHKRGIVHGALGPAQLVVGRDSRVRLDLDGTRTRTRVPARRAPELAESLVPSAAADVWALGEALAPAVERLEGAESLLAILDEMRRADPDARPTARELAERMSGAALTIGGPEVTRDGGSEVPSQLGPYRILSKIGCGGMGAVYRARDEAGGPDVALKVLLRSVADDALSLARFRREARILAELDTPHIARFIHACEHDGWHYLAMEFVDGSSAQQVLEDRGAMQLDGALCVASDVARALADVHGLGLVHRDVKPANILIARGTEDTGEPRAKLCDFGIARLAETDEQVTRYGTPGTPSYMSPEQVAMTQVTASSDVYSFGATLFALLAGEPPYRGGAHLVMAAHVTEPVPDVRARIDGIPEPIAVILETCLAKAPEDRFADGAELLEAIESARRGIAASASVLPQPIDLEGKPVSYEFGWDLVSAPERLWPHVSNTERLNRAIGLDDVAWSRSPSEGGVRTEGQFRAAGMTLRWKENPYEWVAPRRLGVVREYEQGPFEWLRSTVDLEPRSEGGTRLTHKIEIRPRGPLGRVAAGIEVGMRARRGLSRVYQRIDAACRLAAEREPGERHTPMDPFEPPERLSARVGAKIDAALARVVERGADPHVADALGELIREGAPQRLARIRPLEWAAQMGFAGREALSAMLLAAHEGLLATLWDILCPACRIPSQFQESIRALSDHGRCEACDLDFELDLARSVELVFRVDPSIRKADVGVYCIGGPAHSPHVMAQVRMAPGQRFRLDVALPEGGYCLTGRGLPRAHRFQVHRAARLNRWSLPLRAGLDPLLERSLGPGEQRIDLTNDLDSEVLVRLERAAERTDAVTAADAASNGLFRSLFPGEVLSPEQLVGVSRVALLLVALTDVDERYASEDDPDIYRELVELHGQVREASDLEGGALVKLHVDGVLAAFGDSVSATRCGLRLLQSSSSTLGLAVHTGPAMMATINDRLDYFGRTVHVAAHLLKQAQPGELVISDDAKAEPGVEPLLAEGASVIGARQVGATLGAVYVAETQPSVSPTPA